MKSKKAQGAMEYLMTYSWAILVVMIVGIAMWQLGIFNIATSAPTTSVGFNRLKPVTAGSRLTTGGVFDVVLVNGVGTNIVIDSVSANNTVKSGCSWTIDEPDIGDVIFSGGDIHLITTTDLNCGGSIGEIYNIRMTIRYNMSIAGVPQQATEEGSIRGQIA